MSSTLALLTIGQSPRPDMTDAIVQRLPAHVKVLQAGVLDGLCAAEVARDFAVPAGGSPLISRLADGQVVQLGEAAVGQGLQRAVTRLEAQGADGIVLLCTGTFPALRAARAWLIEPDAVVTATVSSLVGTRTLGILAPLPQQQEAALAKWHGVPHRHCAAASPYGAYAALVDAAHSLQAQGAQALVLDCMGYTEAHKQTLLASGVRLPVFVSASVLAGALAGVF